MSWEDTRWSEMPGAGGRSNTGPTTKRPAARQNAWPAAESRSRANPAASRSVCAAQADPLCPLPCLPLRAHLLARLLTSTSFKR